jgi:hypothetical protein
MTENPRRANERVTSEPIRPQEPDTRTVCRRLILHLSEFIGLLCKVKIQHFTGAGRAPACGLPRHGIYSVALPIRCLIRLSAVLVFEHGFFWDFPAPDLDSGSDISAATHDGGAKCPR